MPHLTWAGTLAWSRAAPPLNPLHQDPTLELGWVVSSSRDMSQYCHKATILYLLYMPIKHMVRLGNAILALASLTEHQPSNNEQIEKRLSNSTLQWCMSAPSVTHNIRDTCCPEPHLSQVITWLLSGLSWGLPGLGCSSGGVGPGTADHPPIEMLCPSSEGYSWNHEIVSQVWFASQWQWIVCILIHIYYLHWC